MVDRLSHPLLEPRDDSCSPSPAQLDAQLRAEQLLDARLDDHEKRLGQLEIAVAARARDSSLMVLRSPSGWLLKGRARYVVLVVCALLGASWAWSKGRLR